MNLRACTFFGDCDAPECIRGKLREIINIFIEHYDINCFFIVNKGNFAKIAIEELKEIYSSFPHFICVAISCDTPSDTFADTELDDEVPMYDNMFEEICVNSDFYTTSLRILSLSDYVITYIRNTEDFAFKYKTLAEKNDKCMLNL